jgi:glutamate carboxypeptidase
MKLNADNAKTLALEVAENLKPLLAELVGINSGSKNTDGSNQVLRALEPLYGEMGFTCTEYSVHHPELNDDFPHRLWSRSGAEAQFSMLHVGHVDTVFPKEHPFQSLSRSEERWQGPGVADMKGGLMVMAGVHQLLEKAGLLEHFDSAVFVNSDEEIQSRTSRDLVEKTALGRDAVFVYEPGRAGNGVVRGRKGIARFTVKIHGQSAHSGNHHQSGRSAIKSAASVILALERLTDYDRGVTINVGTIEGGTTRNTVPDRCVLEIDARFERLEDGPWLEEQVKRHTDANLLDGTSAEIDGGVGRPAWTALDEGSPLLDALNSAAQELHQDIPLLSVGGGSDGNFTAAMGIPTIDGLGAVGGGYHTPDEWMNPASLAERIALVALTLTKLP